MEEERGRGGPRQFRDAICLSAKPGNDSLTTCYEVAEIFYKAVFSDDTGGKKERKHVQHIYILNENTRRPLETILGTSLCSKW